MAKIDIRQLGLEGISEEVLAIAERIVDDGGELAKRYAKVGALRAQGLGEDDPEVKAAIDDAEVQAALLVSRLDLAIRGVVSDAVRQWLPKLIVTLISAIAAA